MADPYEMTVEERNALAAMLQGYGWRVLMERYVWPRKLSLEEMLKSGTMAPNYRDMICGGLQQVESLVEHCYQKVGLQNPFDRHRELFPSVLRAMAGESFIDEESDPDTGEKADVSGGSPAPRRIRKSWPVE